MLAHETDHVTHVLHGYAELVDKNPFEFFENRLADEKPVLGKNDLQDIVTEPAGCEGGDQDVGVQTRVP